jgi:hypothetical protein
MQIVPGGYREAIDYVADLWERRWRENRTRPGFTISISAPTNAQAHDVSVAIRERRRKLGEIGADRVAIATTDAEGSHSYDLALARGDRIRLFQRTNAKFSGTATTRNIGRNGTVLEIKEIRDEGLMLRNPAGKEGLVAWSSLKDQRSGRILLAYGDALTTNTAQGTTVTEHIHAIPAGSRLISAFGAYTSGSRHREQSFIVTSEGAERADIVARRPLGDRREIMRGDILNNIIRSFSQQPIKESALDMLDRAAAVRRGTIQMVQSSLLSAEARAAAERRPTALPERFQSRRINQALEERLPRLIEGLRRRGEVIAKAVRTGAAMFERLAALAQRRSLKRETDTEYWGRVQRAGEKFVPSREQADTQKQARPKGRGR